MSLSDAVQFGTKYANKRDVLFVLEDVAGFTHSDVLLKGESEFPQALFNEYEGKIKRLYEGEPLQYVLGKWDFCGINFKTDKRALIPRPETELLAEMVINHAKNRERLNILDVCTGSGCIGLSIAKLTGFKHNLVLADISEEALSLAKQNHKALGSPQNVGFLLSDYLVGVSGMFDIIVSNPPYIKTSELETLPKNVRNYEPKLALDGGAGGLKAYKKLIPQCFEKLRCGGEIFLEIGPPEAAYIMEETGFTSIEIHNDYAGHKRLLRGRKKCLTN